MQWIAQAGSDIGPEFVPEVPDQSADESVRGAKRRFARRGHAGREPRILDHVVEDVAGESSPRRLQLAVGSRGEHDWFDRIRGARPRRAARRANVARVLAPQRAEPGLDRVGDGDVGLALKVALSKAITGSRPLVRNA